MSPNVSIMLKCSEQRGAPGTFQMTETGNQGSSYATHGKYKYREKNTDTNTKTKAQIQRQDTVT